jgi:outer membrane protein assembly factor BamA
VLLVPKLVLNVVFLLPRLAMKVVDELHLIQRVEDLLYFDDAHQFGWSPLVSYQAGYGPTGGAKLFHKSLLGHGEEISISGVYGGRYTQAYRFAFNADRVRGSRLWLDAQARYEAEPGLLFGGIGIVEDGEQAQGSELSPRASNELTYLAQERVLGLLRFGYTAGQRRELVKLGTTVILNDRNFEPNSLDKRQIDSVYDLAALPGFDERVTTLELQVNLVVDLREDRGLDTRGLYLEGFFGGVPEIERFNYLHYGVELAYTLDLYRATRLLRVRVALEAVEGDFEAIPFTDLPRLGGVHRLRGYVEAQFRDKRASLASLEYHYPIHANLSGQLFIDAGYVAARYRDLFELDRWKIGYGGGLLLGSDSDIAFRFDIAYGDGLAVYLSTDLAQAFDGRSDQL